MNSHQKVACGTVWVMNYPKFHNWNLKINILFSQKAEEWHKNMESESHDLNSFLLLLESSYVTFTLLLISYSVVWPCHCSSSVTGLVINGENVWMLSNILTCCKENTSTKSFYCCAYKQSNWSLAIKITNCKKNWFSIPHVTVCSYIYHYSHIKSLKCTEMSGWW